jgi:hypothetical protein
MLGLHLYSYYAPLGGRAPHVENRCYTVNALDAVSVGHSPVPLHGSSQTTRKHCISDTVGPLLGSFQWRAQQGAIWAFQPF